MQRLLVLSASAFTVLACGSQLFAQGQCQTCQTPSQIFQPPRREIVERTIWVPQVTTERRTIQQQQMQRMKTVYDVVPQTVNVNRSVTVLQTRTQTVMRAVPQTVTEQVVVPVQTTETRLATRQVAVMVPVRVQRRVTTQCNCTQSSPGMPTTTTQGQPTIRVIEQIVNQQRLVNQQYRVQVPVTRYVTQTRSRQVNQMQPFQQTTQVPVTIQVPQQQTQTDQVVQYRHVPRQVAETYTVMKPVMVNRVIEVPVTKYVAQKVTQEVVIPGRYISAPPRRVIPACPTCSRALQHGACPNCQSHGHVH